MSRIYRISPHQAEVERKKSLMRSLTFLALIFLAAILFTSGGKDMSGRQMVPFLLFMGALLAFIMLRQIRSVGQIIGKFVATFELETDEVTITKRQADTETVPLAFSEITEIEQRTRQGTRLKTAQSNRHIWVPCELEGYGELVERVRQRSGATLKTRNYNWIRHYSWAVAYLIGWFVVMNAHERHLVLTLSAAMTLGMIWYRIVVWRNPNVSRKLKRSMLFVLLPMVAIIARFYQVW